MRDSIIVDMKYADLDIINGQYGVERHHCLGGPNRKKADEDGLWVPLTPEHHRTGKISAHQSTEVQKLLQMHKVVIKGNYYGRTRTLPDLNDYLHECARHPQMGAKMKRDYQMIVCNAIRTQLPRLTITNPIIIHYNFYEPDKQRDKPHGHLGRRTHSRVSESPYSCLIYSRALIRIWLNRR